MKLTTKLIIIAAISILLACGIAAGTITMLFPETSYSYIFFLLASITVTIIIFSTGIYRYIIVAAYANIEDTNQRLTRSRNILKEKASQSWEEEARFAASIQSLPLGVIMSNANGDIISANDACQRILSGNSQDEDLFTMKINKDLTLKNAISESLRQRNPSKYSGIEYNKKFIDISITPIIVEEKDKMVIGTVTLIQDITEVKIAERSKDEFFSIASHELRTPLTAIRSNTAIIRDYYKDKIDPDIKEIFEDIHEATVRLIKIVNDFLNTSRLEQGRMEFKKESVDITALITSCIKDIQSLAQERKLELQLEPTDNSLKVFADPDKTKEVALNIISNAIKYTEKGSVNIKINPDGDHIKISVTDTGRGIPKQNHGLLFRKFQQASDNILTRDSTQSSGLGLYISKLITEGMGGTLYLESSAEGVGSTFVFTLPKEGI